jgi:hypothetical protein
MTVAVVGAGAIGARHIQAMARLTSSIDLAIVDPILEARRRAAQLLAEAGGLRSGTIREYERVDQLPKVPDLAIVATNSRERPHAVRSLINIGARSLILEKVLFTRLADHDEIDAAFSRTGVRAWVNCPRSAYPRAKRLQELIDDQPFDYLVEGNGWGLGCNLIHYLEEFSCLSHRREIELDSAALEPIVPPASRPGYVEFLGRVSGQALGGGTFAAVCGDKPSRLRWVTIDLGKRRLTLSPEQTLTIEENGRRTLEPYPISPQSELTASYVDAILSGENPKLPQYATSSRLHRTMLGAFLQHLRRVRNDETIDECPVT